MDITQAIIIALLASNGLIVVLVKHSFEKADKTERLCKINNRQADELVMLSNISELLITSEEQLVDALHTKGVLNGNSVAIKQNLNNARVELKTYTKQKKDQGLFL